METICVQTYNSVNKFFFSEHLLSSRDLQRFKRDALYRLPALLGKSMKGLFHMFGRG